MTAELLSVLLNLFPFHRHIVLNQNTKSMTSRKLKGLLMKIVLYISYYVSKKLTLIPWTNRFEKTFRAHESKYLKISLNISPGN